MVTGCYDDDVIYLFKPFVYHRCQLGANNEVTVITFGQAAVGKRASLGVI
jgi:hypothetical protein